MAGQEGSHDSRAMRGLLSGGSVSPTVSRKRRTVWVKAICSKGLYRPNQVLWVILDCSRSAYETGLVGGDVSCIRHFAGTLLSCL